jgi:hypothetical protein
MRVNDCKVREWKNQMLHREKCVDCLDEVNQLWNYLVVSDPPATADVIFVFGSQDLRVADWAAELFLDNHAPTILVTGSYGRMTRGVFEKPEALIFRDRLVRSGIPNNAVICEPRATNTLENVRYGLMVLRHRGVNIRSALLVAKGFVTRRCVATFAAEQPEIVVRACPPTTRLEDSIDRTPKEFIARLVAELDRLEYYGSKGDIVRGPIPRNVQAAAMRIRKEYSLHADRTRNIWL